MASTFEKDSRDVEQLLSREEFVARLRELADAIEQGRSFEINIEGEKVVTPSDAEYSIEHERSDSQEELEFQLKWESASSSADATDEADSNAEADNGEAKGSDEENDALP